MGYTMFEVLLRDKLPFWKQLPEEEKIFVCDHTHALGYPKGATIHDGTACLGVILLQKGCLRVYMTSDEGKEITLSRLHPGEMCMLSAACVLDAITFDVLVDAEEDSECVIISGAAFRALAERNPVVKTFALEAVVARFSDVIWVMQQILCMSLDRRLAIFLSDEIARTGGDLVPLTHEQIAKYMGSAREAVSRMLKYFATEGIAEATRGGVKILNRDKLRRLAL